MDGFDAALVRQAVDLVLPAAIPVEAASVAEALAAAAIPVGCALGGYALAAIAWKVLRKPKRKPVLHGLGNGHTSPYAAALAEDQMRAGRRDKSAAIAKEIIATGLAWTGEQRETRERS